MPAIPINCDDYIVTVYVYSYSVYKKGFIKFEWN